MVENPPAMQETQVRFLGWEDPSGEGNGDPLQYSCLENPMDRGAWRATQSMGSQESNTTERLNHQVTGDSKWLLYSCFGAHVRGTCVEIPVLIKKKKARVLLFQRDKYLQIKCYVCLGLISE